MKKISYIFDISHRTRSRSTKFEPCRLCSCLFAFFFLLLFAACTETVSDAKQEAEQPHIYPDYIGVTIPVNIAPLCFNMVDEMAFFNLR